MNTNFIAWLTNIAAQVPYLIEFVGALAYLSGIGFVVLGLMKFKAFAQNMSMMSQQKSISEPIICFGVGIILIFYAGFVEAGSATLFGSDWLSYSNGELAGITGWDTYTVPIIAIVRLIGYIAFLKGIYLITRAGQHSQQGGIHKAIVHMVGGILAINFEATWMVLYNTITGS